MTHTLAETLSHLHEFNIPFKPPATTAQLDDLAARLTCTLNDSLIALYRDHNGIHPDWGESDWRLRFALRFMSSEEVIAANQMLRDYETEHPEYWFPPDAPYFWNEGSSDYAGVYVSGLLAGKVCLYDHEDPGFAPRFRSIASFYSWQIRYMRAIMAVANPDDMHSWHDDDIPSDYPLFQDAPETDAADMKLARELTAQFEGVSDRSYDTRRYRHYLGYSAMNLMPFSESEQLLPFTYDTDMWIQARACELLGKRRYQAAIPRLAEVALDGTHNGHLAAIDALARMRTPEAKMALLTLQSQSPSNWYETLKWALEAVDQPLDQ